MSKVWKSLERICWGVPLCMIWNTIINSENMFLHLVPVRVGNNLFHRSSKFILADFAIWMIIDEFIESLFNLVLTQARGLGKRCDILFSENGLSMLCTHLDIMSTCLPF